MLAPSLLPCLALLAAPQAGGWTRLALPDLCAERLPGPWLEELGDGRHLRLEPTERNQPESRRAELSISQLASLLESEVRRRGRSLTTFAGTAPLLVQGGAEDVELARSLVAALDAAGARTWIELEVELGPASGVEGARSWKARARSGDRIAFGERRQQAYVSGFDVDVSSGSGVAAPVAGSILSGATVHLRVARADQGRKVHIAGLLDLSELLALRDFDPRCIDLGVLQQPELASLQISFAGVVENGGTLAVRVRGAPLGRKDWTLGITARTTPEPSELPAGSWRLLDLALLSAPQRELAPVPLGLVLGSSPGMAALGSGPSPVSPASLLLRSEGGRRAGARAAVGYATERSILLPAEESELWSELAELGAALESERLLSTIVRIAHGELEVELPIARGEPARVLAGVERSWLVRYLTQIAPDTWMPQPIVDSTFDGICWEAWLGSGALHDALSLTRTHSSSVRKQEEAVMGDLQLLERSLRSAQGRRDPASAAQTLLEASGDSPALVLRFPAP